MEIRYANSNDTLKIIRAIQNKKMEYNTPAHIKADIQNHRLIIAVEGDKILGQVAVEPKPQFNYTGICRLCVYSKRWQGKGIATALIKYVCGLGLTDLGATPWDTNPVMCQLLEKFGFKYQYSFLDHYRFYKR